MILKSSDFKLEIVIVTKLYEISLSLHMFRNFFCLLTPRIFREFGILTFSEMPLKSEFQRLIGVEFVKKLMKLR